MEDDRALVLRFQSGDRTAFDELVRRHRAGVGRLVCRMMRSRDEMDDIVQDVFIQAFRSIGSFRGEARFGTWLYRVTLNVVLMHRRATKCRPVMVLTDKHVAPDHRALPDEQADRRERFKVFETLLSLLSDKKREAFVLHDIEGVQAKEIALRIGVSTLTVRTRLFYARQELAQMLALQAA